MLSGFGLNLKGSISAPLGERKMCKGLKKKKKKNKNKKQKTRPTNMHIHQTHYQTARFCHIQIMNKSLLDLSGFPGLSKTCSCFPGLSTPGNKMSK